MAAPTGHFKSRMNSKNSEIAGANDAGHRRFLKPKVLATRLGVCPKTLFRWAAAGKIHRFKPNARIVLFDEAEAIAFIESGRVQSP